jgi:Flp pilus assembly pilin Flp
MLTILTRLVEEESGQDLAEYGIALAVVGIGAALAAIAIAGNVSTLWSKASSMIVQAV